jgi:hypothetical protein
MGQVEFVLNQLAGRDPVAADRFEREIEQAVAAWRGVRLRCRILAWEFGLDALARDRVTVVLHAPGWVKALGVPVQAPPGEVRRAVLRALGVPPRLRVASGPPAAL